MSEDFPKVVTAFATSLAEMVKLGRLPVENLSVILKDSVDSGFALKTILETANIILQQVCPFLFILLLGFFPFYLFSLGKWQRQC